MSKEVKLEVNNNDELNEKLNELTKDASINKPSEEEVEQAKVEFDEAVEKWGKTIYNIGTPEQAEEFWGYIDHFIEKRVFWQKEAWMGVIKMKEELDASAILFRTNKESFQLSYQALEFAVFSLQNLGGFGLQSALDFESESELYIKVLSAMGEELETSRKNLKDIEFLQQKWGAMSQGFYLEVDDTLEEKEAEEELPPGVEEDNKKED